MPVENEGFIAEHRKKKVLLAAVSSHMSRFRDNLHKELKNNGYQVEQIDNSAEEINRIPEIIDQYDIAIHLLSDHEDYLSEGGKGIEEQQILYTVQHYLSQKLISDSHDELFTVYAWHAKSRVASIFVEENLAPHLRKIQQLEEVEFLRTNFEDFKYYLLKTLETEKADIVDAHHFIKGQNNLSIYFLYDAPDSEEAEKYLDYLKRRGFTVLSPQFGGDIMSIRQTHQNSLKSFDLAIIFANKAGVNWVNMKIMDILKSPGFGREKEIVGKAILLPENMIKMCPLSGRGFDVIPFDLDLSEDQIDVFLNKNLL